MKKRSKKLVMVKNDSEIAGYDTILSEVIDLLESARHASARAVNVFMTATYWLIGRRIIEWEQAGKERATYGEALINRLSADITKRFGRGFSRQNLQKMRLIYRIYPPEKICQTLSGEFKELVRVGNGKLLMTSPEIFEALSLAFPLSWSHYVRLISVDNEDTRRFYEAEALRGGWSVRQIDRQISTLFYERTLLSKNKAAMLKKGTEAKPEDAVTPEEEIKDPFVLEFLNLKDEDSENDLEEALIQHLEKFLLELGGDFAFIGRQRRIVARIEELAAKIEEARGLRKKAGEEVEALFASSKVAIFEKQPCWKEARVGDFCEPPQYGYTESATTEPIGPRFLRITDIQNGHVDWDSVPFCNCPDSEKYLLKENDLVFARTGATTGKSFLITKCPEAIFASYLIRLRVKHSVSIEYLYQYFQTPSYWSQITDEKKGTGQPNVNGKKLANISVPLPPLPEQRRIVAYLDILQAKVDALRRLQAETGAEFNALLPAVLDMAFKGEM